MKLPTAYQTLNHHLSRAGLTLATAHESILLDAIESHTQAHTAGLRERAAQLEGNGLEMMKIISVYADLLERWEFIIRTGATTESIYRETKEIIGNDKT